MKVLNISLDIYESRSKRLAELEIRVLRGGGRGSIVAYSVSKALDQRRSLAEDVEKGIYGQDLEHSDIWKSSSNKADSTKE